MRCRRAAGFEAPVAAAVALGADRWPRRRHAGTPPVPELERELHRELHQMPPPALLPIAGNTQACYDRLAKIAHFTPVPIRSEPAQCATASTWCGSSA